MEYRVCAFGLLLAFCLGVCTMAFFNWLLGLSERRHLKKYELHPMMVLRTEEISSEFAEMLGVPYNEGDIVQIVYPGDCDAANTTDTL